MKRFARFLAGAASALVMLAFEAGTILCPNLVPDHTFRDTVYNVHWAIGFMFAALVSILSALVASVVLVAWMLGSLVAGVVTIEASVVCILLLILYLVEMDDP